MKIVVLDGYTLNPGDLSWEGVKELGDLTIHDHTPPHMTLERIQDAELVLTNKAPLGKEIMDKAGKLRYIGLLATGYNIIDTEYAASKNITVVNVPAYSTYSVMQQVFALVLQFTNRTKEQSDSVHRGDWVSCRDFCYLSAPLSELYGKTLGIVGFGQIGRQVAKTAEAFGMQVLAQNRSPKDAPAYVHLCDLDTVLRESDVVTLHCPLNAENQGMINQQSLSKMKATALLINTARGGLIVEEDLASALNNGIIAGAALDVLSTEPPTADNPLLTAKNCIITPHVAWATQEARARLMDIVVDNLRQFIAGTPVNVVN